MEGCPLCSQTDLVLTESESSKLLANYYPIGKISFLFIPKDCINSITKIAEKKFEDFVANLHWTVKTIEQELNLEGLNIFINLGKIAGQSINHLHVHIVPRECGDDVSNFKIAGTHKGHRLTALTSAFEDAKLLAEKDHIKLMTNGNPALWTAEFEDEKLYSYTQFDGLQNSKMFKFLKESLEKLQNSEVKPDGFNIFINQGHSGEQEGENTKINILIRFEDDEIKNFARPNDGKVPIDPKTLEELKEIFA